ncbi:MAG: hypothetical protein LUG84_04035 [Akkermansiaceae bacterium]|nr:hypothetical protein [Akkermansia sp.]MCD7798564.1 hypothetical protein [Akkermansiaceae bacterium]MCD8070795.1 hypothetical protein [Akkermansiaceae bacterium]
MDIQVAVLCDYAADYQGKLCVQGAFDTLFARQFPVVHPACALALRLCLTPEDAGDHKLGISIVDEDGVALDPERMPIVGDLHVALPDGAAFLTRNLIMNFQGLKFEKAGTYSVDVTLGGEIVSRTPLRLVQLQQQDAPQHA